MSPKPPRINREQRHNCKVDMKHDVVIPDIHYDGTIFNLSSGGIFFESNERILIGDEISVTVQKLNGDEITFDVCIIWKKDLSNSSYRFGYGAQSINPIESMAQVSTESREQMARVEDKRHYQRIVFNKQIRMKKKTQEYKGRIRDISRGGAFIETDLIFPIGNKIALSLSWIKSEKIVKLTGWIVRKDERGFGITFDRRSGSERRHDIDRRKGRDRRNSKNRRTE